MLLMCGSKFSTIRSTTQIWVVTCHQYGISTLVSQMSFCRGKKWWCHKNVGCFIMLHVRRFLIQMILLVHLDRQGEGENNFPAENDVTKSCLHWQLSVSAEKCNSFQFSPSINPTSGTKVFSIQDKAGPGHSKFRWCYPLDKSLVIYYLHGQTGWFMVWVKYNGKQTSG